ncbi:PKD domain-containing protein [Haloglomus litoreum]|uniref:PKD domain-containing protein n=1 Tax=Haloglomus litoreum TaxID=3034026 RepID=UPI0023E7CCB4|nr:PKD domain-containing protein [Haloglomus sp. DT116]
MQATRARLVPLVLLVAAATVATGGVVGAEEPPLADAGLDQQVQQNATVLLDAAGSRDPDGEIRSYSWTIETPDGRTVRPADPDAARTSFVARQPGRYEATVTVTGEDGQSASDTLYVDVVPHADPGLPETPDSPPTDTTPGLPESSSPVSDGVVDPATPDAPLSTTDAPSPTDTAAASGSGPACPSARTRVGSLGCLQGEDPPATVEVQGELYVRQGSVHTYTALVEDRPGGNERLDWSGGVGTGNTLTRMFAEPPGSTVTITATVDDGEGHTSSDSIVVHVVAGNSPPEVRIEGPTQACVGEPVELEGYAVTSEESDEIIDSTWHSDPTFVPQGPGRYEVGFSATDRQNQTAKTTHTVTVREDGGCAEEGPNLPDTQRGSGEDKLLIRASDDNWVEGSEVSALMRANEKVPESGALEKLADVGAATGKFGEASAELVTGNRETMVVTMSAENASELAEKIESTPSDDTVAGAAGPRINEHERLKNARVKDPVETEDGRVRVVIRIGKNNEGSPDQYEQPDSTASKQEALSGRREPESTSEGGTAESAEPSLPSSDEQTNVLERSGPVDSATQVADTVSETVESAVSSLVGGTADSGGTDASPADTGGTGSPEPDESPGADTSNGGDSSSGTGSEDTTEDDSTDSTSGSITEAFSEIAGGDSSDSSEPDDNSGDSSDGSGSDPSDGSNIGGDSPWGGLL